MTDAALKGFSTRTTPQSEPIPGSDQIENSAGGYTWATEPWQRLRRFLILGTDGGTYYIGPKELTRENAEAVLDMIRKDGPRVLAMVREVSLEGRAPKNDQAIFCLAMAAKLGDDLTRKQALETIPEICRTGTHLFQFLGYMEQFGGWSKATKRAIGAWYLRPVGNVAFQAVKYRQREGWTHRDVLRLAKPKPQRGSAHDQLFAWIVGREDGRYVGAPLDEGLAIVEGFERAQLAATAQSAAALIREYNLPREAIQTEHLASPEVWDALLEKMPLTALIRNLATMTRIGLLTPTSTATQNVLARLASQDALQQARIHPVGVLGALVTYARGRGVRGSNTWIPIPQIIDALDGAFYRAFGNVEPTGKSILIGLDVSTSMDGHEIGAVPGLSARVGAAAMCLVTAAVESRYEAVAFTGGGYGGYGAAREQNTNNLTPFPISARERLDDVVQRAQALPFGGTDCALPILYAQANEREVDAFLIYTDNETWAGTIHPAQALRDYREKSGIDAKMIVVGMAANEFTLADPDDKGMLDVVGFDTATPQLMSEFIAGRL